jgi:tetratricopeptide (TPR) repeat protein
MTSPVESTREQLADAIVRCIDANDVPQGLAWCQQLNREHPGYAYGWYLASFLMRRVHRLRDALRAIERAVAIEDLARYRLHQARCLYESGDMTGTAAVLGPLQGRSLGEARLHSEMGSLLLLLGRHADSLAQYTRAVELEPAAAEYRFNQAALYRYLGQVEAAEAGFDAALTLKPTEYEAYNARSQVRTQTPQRNHVEQLQQVIARTADPAGLVQLHYALAKEYEDLGDYEAAFRNLEAGAGTKRRHMRYQVETDLAIMDAIAATYDRSRFDGRQSGCPDTGPIFVLGMPRTGTTLVERVLSSHPDVQSAGELNTFGLELMRLARQGAAPPASRIDFVRATAQVDFAALGRAYLQGVQPLRDGRPWFVDKLPFNFLYAGLIHLALPNARIIHLRRHPLDTCFAVYKQLFKDAYPFSYDLEELGRYYVAYHRLMEHWHGVMPGVVLDVRYEDVVADLEGQARRLVAHCGLPWNDACVRFHENVQASTTASATQVRRPVYDTSVGKWRRVERQLEPVRVLLQRAGIDVG